MTEHIVVVTGIVKFKDKFLILKRNDKMEMHPGKWSFPGGKVKAGEDLFSALKRLFGDTVRCKNIRTQTAELFCRLIAYNIGYRRREILQSHIHHNI